jgi:hypothetical protein
MAKSALIGTRKVLYARLRCPFDPSPLRQAVVPNASRQAS